MKRANGEGNVRKRPDGRWEARLEYVDETTGKSRRQSFYAPTSKAARDKLRAALERLNEGQPVRDASATLGDVCRVWRTTTLVASSRKDTTKALYAGLLTSHVECSPVAAKRLDRLRSSDVNALVIELRAKTKARGERRLSEPTVEKIIRVLRLVLDGAIRDQLLARNPVDASERVSAPRKDAHYLPATDVLKILQAASHTRYASILSLIATTGLRKGEALALLWDDVDLERGTLRVRKTLSRVDGDLVRTDPKTEKSKRTIPLRGTAAAVLREHRKLQLVERVRAANIWTDTGYVFATETGQPMDPRNVLRAMTTAATKAGLGGVNVHTLRHSAATHWLENGVHLRAVSDLLGHSSTRITGDVYAHTSDEAASRAMDVLGSALALGESS